MARSPHDRRGGRRPRVVALIGIDGSGKTTQAHRLVDSLTAAGLAASYCRNAGGRRWFGRLARRLGRSDAQRLLGRAPLLLVESALRWLAIARALLWTACRGRVAVMDRYAVCQYASIRAHSGRGREPLARFCYRLFPPPDLTILLSVEPVEAYWRIERRGTDHESLAFLTAAAAAYRALPESASFLTVDANCPPDAVARTVGAMVRGWLDEYDVPPDPDTGGTPGGGWPHRRGPGASELDDPDEPPADPDGPATHRRWRRPVLLPG